MQAHTEKRKHPYLYSSEILCCGCFLLARLFVFAFLAFLIHRHVFTASNPVVTRFIRSTPLSSFRFILLKQSSNERGWRLLNHLS